MRNSTASVKVKVKTKAAMASFITGSRKRKAMMRGVSWALASWTASKRTEERKTMKVNMEAARVPRTARAPSGLNVECQPIACSTPTSRRTQMRAATIATTGKSHSESRDQDRI